MTCSTRRLRDERGVSLTEIMVMVAIMGILTSMTVVQIGAVRPGMQADGAMRLVMAQLNSARETAISQRRLVEVSFPNGFWVRTIRRNLPTGTPPTVLSELPFEGTVQYGIQANTTDTPDGFGNSKAIDFGAATSVMFNTEGMLVDNGGYPVNGTLFMLIPNQPTSFRAVTILGSTGRVRAFRWSGYQWDRV
jgi:type II secretory pathway pseudopilin PulG